MDRIVTHTLGIHRKKMRKIPGNTEKYYAQIAQDGEIYEKTRANDERKQKEIELFITRFRAKARLANLVQSRVKTLEKMDKNSKLDKIKELEFSFQEKPFNAKYLLNAGNLSFSYRTWGFASLHPRLVSSGPSAWSCCRLPKASGAVI